MNRLTISRTEDFELTASPEVPAWRQAAWHDLTPIQRADAYRTRVKVLYSRLQFGLFR